MYREDPSTPTQVYFLDDFGGAAYDNRVWNVTVGGASTLQKVSAIAGQIEMSVAASGGTCLLAQGSGYNFSVAKNLEMRWQVKMSTRTNFYFEIGARVNSTNWLAWISDSATSANWIAASRNGGTPTSNVTDVAIDTNWHETQIICRTGSILFLLDGILKSTITTTIPTGGLQLYAYGITTGAAARTVRMDFVEALGNRE